MGWFILAHCILTLICWYSGLCYQTCWKTYKKMPYRTTTDFYSFMDGRWYDKSNQTLAVWLGAAPLINIAVLVALLIEYKFLKYGTLILKDRIDLDYVSVSLPVLALIALFLIN